MDSWKVSWCLAMLVVAALFSGCVSEGVPATTVPGTILAPTIEPTTMPPSTAAPTSVSPTQDAPEYDLVPIEGIDGAFLLDGEDVTVSIDSQDYAVLEAAGAVRYWRDGTSVTYFGTDGKGSVLLGNGSDLTVRYLLSDRMIDDGFEEWLFDTIYEDSNVLREWKTPVYDNVSVEEYHSEVMELMKTLYDGQESPDEAVSLLCKGLVDNYLDKTGNYERYVKVMPTGEMDHVTALYLNGKQIRVVEDDGEVLPQVYFVDLTLDTDELYDKYVNVQESDADIYNMIEKYFLTNYAKGSCVEDNIWTSYINDLIGIDTNIEWENNWFDTNIVYKNESEYVGNEQDSFIKANLKSGIYLELCDILNNENYDEFEFGITKDDSEIHLGSNYYRIEDFEYDSNIFLHTSYDNFESTEKSVYDDEIFFDDDNQLRLAMTMSPLSDKQLYYSKEILSHYTSDNRVDLSDSLSALYHILYDG